MGQDASVAGDGPTPSRVPPRVMGLRVTDARGVPWPVEAVPRRPVLHLDLSEPSWDADPPVWLLFGPPDDELLEDLRVSPLRAAQRARVVPSRLEATADGCSLVPEARLERGTRLTLAVGAWLRGGGTGLRMGSPWAVELTVSAAPEAGAAAVSSWPADGTGAVPSSLRAAVVRFDGPVHGVSEGVRLRDAEGSPVPGEIRYADCRDEGWPDGWCASVVLYGPLGLGRDYVVEVAEAVHDATGAPVGPWSARFQTAIDLEDEPPALRPLVCALDERAEGELCVLADDTRALVRLQASEPVRVSLSLAGRALLAVAPRGSASLSLIGIPPSTSFAAVLRLEGLGGAVLERSLTLSTSDPLATLAVMEVRSDPLGPEPRQEYVEVLNYGVVPLDLHLVALSDHPGRLGNVVPRPERLAPGQRALLVPDEFDPDDPADPAVPPGVPLVRVGRALGSAGLANAGEPVFLRDPELRRLSAAPAVSTGAGRCLVRVGDDLRGDDPSLFVVGPCTPGLAP